MFNMLRKPHRRKTTARQERRFWLIWTLCMVPASIGLHWFGLIYVLPVLLGIAIVTMLYQRHVAKRSWDEILWGDRIPDEQQ